MPKFADDVKIYSSVATNSDQSLLQSAIEHVNTWSSKWQLPINVQKCLTFPIGKNNSKFTYSLENFDLKSEVNIKDLGVHLSSDLNFSNHCNQVVSRAKRIGYMLRRCFVSRDVPTLIKAFVIYVRPILEYASPVWSPHFLKDIKHIESVQRSFTKYLPGCYNLSYKQRLNHLGLESLELRRLHADLCLTYSILRGLVDLEPKLFFSIRGNEYTRGHPYKLTVAALKKDCRKYFFSNRVVHPWNSLPSGVVNSTSLQQFRRGLKRTDLSKFLKCF